jgi:two-component system, chemotaxis family, protein-glutamate methylesterase/glutaminase
MANKIRTLLIDDSPFMRKVIGDIITADAELDLVGTAANGREGSALAVSLKPDVVVTDMVMPEYDGTYLVRSVMDQRTPLTLR